MPEGFASGGGGEGGEGGERGGGRGGRERERGGAPPVRVARGGGPLARGGGAPRATAVPADRDAGEPGPSARSRRRRLFAPAPRFRCKVSPWAAQGLIYRCHHGTAKGSLPCRRAHRPRRRRLPRRPPRPVPRLRQNALPRFAPRRPAPPRAAPRRPAALSTCDTSVTRVTTSNTPRPRAARRRSEPVVDEAQGKQGPEERVARPVAPRRRAPGKEDPVPPGGRRRPRVRLLQRAHQPRVGRRP